MIKGRYVATVTIDFHVPDELEAKFHMNEAKNVLINEYAAEMKMIIEDRCDLRYQSVDVQRQYADLYHVPDDETEDEYGK